MSYQVLFNFITHQECHDLHNLIGLAVWEEGRQKSRYEKTSVPKEDVRFTSLINRSLQALNAPSGHGFDCWILRYPVGSYIPAHLDDALFGSEHWRLNAIIQSDLNAEFILNNRRIDLRDSDAIIFRPDKHVHSVTEVVETNRYVWSVGVLL